jgi:hypothetical protein
MSYVPHTLRVPPPPHACGEGHAPQESTVRFAPQLSFAVTEPQFLPSRVQNARSVSDVQTHTLAVTKPQVHGAVQLPHELTVRLVPQLSTAVTPPQVVPSREQNAGSVSGVQQTLPPLQVCDIPHVPQELTVRLVPQWSAPATLPQFLPSRAQNAASVSAMQAQTLLEPHVCGNVQSPHEITVRPMPQLSLPTTLPHVLPSRAQKAVSVS